MHSNVFPLRTTQSKMGTCTCSATDFESFVDRLSPHAIPTIFFEAEGILDMRIVESDREYKIQWHDYGRRDATWETESHLLQYGATELIVRYEAKQTAAGNKKMTKGIAKKRSVRTMFAQLQFPTYITQSRHWHWIYQAFTVRSS